MMAEKRSKTGPDACAGKRAGRSSNDESAVVNKHAEDAALLASEQSERTFDAVPDPIAILDTQYRIVRVNKAMAERLGLGKDQCAGQTCYRLVDGTDEPPPSCPYAALLQDGEEHAVEVHGERLAGDFLVTVSPLRDSAGRLIGGVHVTRDLTSRKRAEQLLQIQHDLALGLAAARSLGDAMPLCLDAAIRASGMDAGGLYLVDRATGSLNVACSQGLSPEFVAMVSHYDANSPNACLVAKGQTLYTRHHELRVGLGAAERAEGLRALAVVPVLLEGSAIACLNVASHTLEEISVGARRVVEGIAAQIGDAIARLQGEEEVRFQATLPGQIQDLITATDLQGRITYVNEAECRAFGKSREELIGQHVQTYGEDSRRGATQREIIERTRNEGQWRGEVVNLAESGREIVLDCRTQLLLDDSEQPVGLLGISTDITERKRAEQALRRSERMRAEAEKLAATGQMAAQVAHEINNPLAGIKNSFRLIRDAVPGDHRDHDMIARIEREIDRIAHIVRQIYKVHSPRAQTPSDNLLDETIRDVLAMLEPLHRGAIVGTIEVLKKTKETFKSKALADLRRQLEGLVGTPEAFPRRP